jgi:hypothetical protein
MFAQAIHMVKDSHIRAALVDALEETRWQLAAPFVERVRLAALFIEARKVFQAETALHTALQQSLGLETVQSEAIQVLRESALETLRSLKIQNNLLELFDANVAALDADNDGAISKGDLVEGIRQHTHPDFQAFIAFLLDNYKQLTRHGQLQFNHAGITRNDVVRFVEQRSKEIRDFR